MRDALIAVSTGFLCFSGHAIAGAVPASAAPFVQSSDRLAQATSPNPAPSVPPRSLPPGVLQPDRPDIKPLPSTLPTPSPTPSLESPPAAPPTPSSTPTATIQIRAIKILGSTVFSQAQLAAVVQEFIGKAATFEDLLKIRTAVTDFYTRQGYTTSGAFLPPQEVSSGIITVQVVEGELERVEIRGLRHLQAGYIRSRIGRVARPPLNIRQLETALQLLQLDPLLSSVQAELTVGTSPGQSILVLNLQEAPPFHSALLVENRDPPSVGSVRGSVSLSHNNLLGFGDRLSASYGLTEGIHAYDLAYEVPLTASNGKLSLRYSREDSQIIEEPFASLDISSESQTLSLGFQQPIWQTPTSEFGLGLTADFRKSRTFFGQIPFSFSLGPENGTAAVSVLRFSQDWVDRSPTRVLAARSQFSLGLDAFGATVNDSGVDGRFFSWVGQFQWVQSLGGDVLAILRLAAQFTPDALLPLEQFSIGGVDTVRGYLQNQRVGDNGVAGSLEVRLPIVRNRAGTSVLQLAPFFDIGTVWNNQKAAVIPRPLLSPTTLISVGLGLRLQLGSTVSARLDWGIPLRPIAREGNTLQDDGIFFSLQVQPF